MRNFILTLLFSLIIVNELSAQAPSYQWAYCFGDTSRNEFELGHAIEMDAAGNVYVVGSLLDTLDMDRSSTGVTNLIAPFGGLFFAKYDGAGNLIWAKQINGNAPGNFLYANKLLLDNQGNIYLTGGVYGTVYFDNIAATSLDHYDMYIAKYDALGNCLYAKTMGGTGYQTGHSLAIDANYNVCVTGVFEDSIDFDPSASTALFFSNTGNRDSFIAKYNPSGNYLWAKVIGGGTQTESMDLGIDNNDNLYITGHYYTADFDPSPAVVELTSYFYSQDIFLAKYNSSGDYVWVKSLGRDGMDGGEKLKVGSNNQIFISGLFGSSADFDPSNDSLILTAHGFRDVFIGSYDTGGNLIWAERIGESFQFLSSMDIDNTNNMYITGHYEGAMDMDPSSNTAILTPEGQANFYLAKYNSSGNYLWAKTIGGPDSTTAFPRDLAADANGNIAITGHISSYVNFNNSPASTFYSNGGTDVFILKYGAVTAVNNSLEINNTLSINPNPVNEYLSIELPLTNNHLIHLIIYDLQGKQVYKELFQTSGNMNKALNLSWLTPGMYNLVLKTDNAVYNNKIVVN